MKALLKPVAVVCLLTLFLSGSALAGIATDEAGSEVSKRCIQISRIKDMDVIDDRTIVFTMLNNKEWKNTLPYPCSQLKVEGGSGS